MLNSLFTIINAKVQYDIQRNARGGGIIGIALFLLILIKWNDWFYPIFNKLGLVRLARESGLIQQTAVGTFFAVSAVLFVLLVILTLIVFSGTIITTIFLALPTPIQMFLYLPLLLILLPIMAFTNLFKNKEVDSNSIDYANKELLTEEEYFENVANGEKQYLYKALSNHTEAYKRGKLYIQQYSESHHDTESLTYEETLARLNTVISSLDNPKNYVVAYSSLHGGGWYILGPQPLPAYVSKVMDYNNGYSLKSTKEALNSYTDSAELYVPAQPIYMMWNEKTRRYDVTVLYNVAKEFLTKGQAKMLPLTAFTDFHYINENAFISYYKNHERLLSMNTVIKQSHELTYLIPLYFDNELEKQITGHPNFIEATTKVTNYDVFPLLYMSDVESKLRDLVIAGDMQALKAYRKMENQHPENNIS